MDRASLTEDAGFYPAVAASAVLASATDLMCCVESTRSHTDSAFADAELSLHSLQIIITSNA